jgi:hypothetical protein
LDRAAAGIRHVHVARRRVHRASPPAGLEDENGVLFLSGFFQSLQGANTDFVTAKNATLVAVALDKKADLREAFKSATVYFEKKKQEESKDYQLEPTESVKEGPVGDQPGCFGEFKLKRGTETMRFVLLAVFNDGAKTYGLRCECAWENQAIWRTEFLDLIKTVRLTKK